MIWAVPRVKVTAKGSLGSGVRWTVICRRSVLLSQVALERLANRWFDLTIGSSRSGPESGPPVPSMRNIVTLAGNAGPVPVPGAGVTPRQAAVAQGGGGGGGVQFAVQPICPMPGSTLGFVGPVPGELVLPTSPELVEDPPEAVEPVAPLPAAAPLGALGFWPAALASEKCVLSRLRNSCFASPGLIETNPDGPTENANSPAEKSRQLDVPRRQPVIPPSIVLWTQWSLT